MNPIEAAVLPMKQDAIDRAEKAAKGELARIAEKIAEAGNDLQICAPYPNSRMVKVAYVLAVGKYHFYRKICTRRPNPDYRMDAPYLADVNPEECAKWIIEVRKHAAAQYEAFVAKLVKKIGPVRHATLTGNHVWGYSHLIVNTEAGENQIWRTRMIINVSCLGKVFNQFPTRKVKEVE